MSGFKNKAFTADADTLAKLDEIGKHLGNINMSACIRYCVKQVFNQLKKKGA